MTAITESIEKYFCEGKYMASVAWTSEAQSLGSYRTTRNVANLWQTLPGPRPGSGRKPQFNATVPGVKIAGFETSDAAHRLERSLDCASLVQATLAAGEQDAQANPPDRQGAEGFLAARAPGRAMVGVDPPGQALLGEDPFQGGLYRGALFVGAGRQGHVIFAGCGRPGRDG
jgi:hypothetical protein